MKQYVNNSSKRKGKCNECLRDNFLKDTKRRNESKYFMSHNHVKKKYVNF